MAKVRCNYYVDPQYTTATVVFVLEEDQRLYSRHSFNLAQLESRIGELSEIRARPESLPYEDPLTKLRFDLDALRAHMSGLVELRSYLRLRPELQNWNQRSNHQRSAAHREAGSNLGVDDTVHVWDGRGEPWSGGGGGHGAI